MLNWISAAAAKAAIHGAQECALLDIREHGQYGEGHPFLSVHCPYSDFEQSVQLLVPNTATSVILMDDGDGLAQKAASQMVAMGYTQVCALQGGAAAWAAAGYTLYQGVNLPSKTLGELVEHAHHPQLVSAQTLRSWQSEGRGFHFFDCRPPSEYAKMTVPGAACVPNGELAHRLAAVVPDDDLPIVVTCAGRTRGLIGAAGLALLGLNRPVFALENGTQGWALAGLALQRGNGLPDMPELKPEQLALSRQRADGLIQAQSLSCIGRETFLDLASDINRTLYLVDVRSAAEFRRGHLPGAQHAWSGQIAQAADLSLGVRRARVVLCDDTGLRAALAAVWLRMLGYEVFIWRETSPDALQAHWRLNKPQLPSAPPLRTLSAAEVADSLRSGQYGLLDLRPSQAYRQSHIEGANWISRARLNHDPALPGRAQAWILMAPDALTAAFVALDLRQLGLAVHGVFTGSLSELQAQGCQCVSTPKNPPDADCIDFLFFVHDRHDGNLESAKRYLSWEMGLIAQLDEAERASFCLTKNPA